MAGAPINTQIDDAVGALCADLNARFVNFLDSRTLPHHHPVSSERGCVVATGSHAAGVWKKGDDVHLIFVGDNSLALFWAFVQESLHLSSAEKMEEQSESGKIELSSKPISKGIQADGGSIREFVRLSRRDQAHCRFFLHYCRFPRGFSLQDLGCNELPAYDGDHEETIPTQGNLQVVRGMQTLAASRKMNDTREKAVFIDLYDKFYYWLKAHGLFGPNFGFLGNNHLVWLTHDAQPDNTTVFDDLSEEENYKKLLNLAFNTFKKQLLSQCRQIEGAEAAIPYRLTGKLDLSPGKGMHPPPESLVDDAVTKEAKAAIENALLRAKDVDLTIDNRTTGYNQFMNEHDYFFQIDCVSWLHDKRADFHEIDVPRNLNRVVKAMRGPDKGYHIDSIRVWPEAVSHTADADEEAQVILIGINRLPSAQEERTQYKTLLSDVQQRMEQEVLDYSRIAGMISFTMPSRADLEARKDPEAPCAVTPGEAFSVQRGSPPQPTPPRREIHSPTVAGTNVSPSAFLDAHAAISKLRYDPRHAPIEYEVGYQDRFKDELVWVPLEMWGGKETEEIDFIPEHRVKMLRRADNHWVVWDRIARIDLT